MSLEVNGYYLIPTKKPSIVAGMVFRRTGVVKVRHSFSVAHLLQVVAFSLTFFDASDACKQVRRYSHQL